MGEGTCREVLVGIAFGGMRGSGGRIGGRRSGRAERSPPAPAVVGVREATDRLALRLPDITMAAPNEIEIAPGPIRHPFYTVRSLAQRLALSERTVREMVRGRRS